MFSFVKKVLRDEQGATAVEYGLILALVFLAMVGAITSFGSKAIGVWTNVSNAATKSAG